MASQNFQLVFDNRVINFIFLFSTNCRSKASNGGYSERPDFRPLLNAKSPPQRLVGATFKKGECISFVIAAYISPRAAFDEKPCISFFKIVTHRIYLLKNSTPITRSGEAHAIMPEGHILRAWLHRLDCLYSMRAVQPTSAESFVVGAWNYHLLLVLFLRTVPGLQI